ncbi:MAG: DUF433 domain-containing protein [Candidatus Ozemobacteraceae bacterium]
MATMKNDFEKFIVFDMSVALHQPVIKNTKLTVEQILDLFAEGKTQDEILKLYPFLTPKHIRAVFGFTCSIFQRYKFIPELPSDEKHSAKSTLKNVKGAQKNKLLPTEEPFIPKTPLAKKLWKFRQEIVASDVQLLTMDEIRQEVCERRGERE